MKIRMLALLLALFCTLSFAACDTPAPDTDPTGTDAAYEEEETTEEPIVINEDTMVLARDKATEYFIVRSVDSTDAEIKAAYDLHNYISKMTGCRLRIITDDQPETDYEIVVGYTNRQSDGQFDESALGDEGFVIEHVGKKIFIAGSDTHGALYGVYTFLDEYLGVRFYSSEYEYIPKKPVLVVQPFERDVQIPVFAYRDVDFVTSRVDDYQAKLKLNGMYAPGDASVGGRVDYVGGFVHTFNNLVPPSVYGASHPEYWGMNPDGTPQPEGGRQLCLSNPEVLAIATESVRQLLQNNPSADIISISQNDSGEQLPCMCKNCQAIYDEEGAYSGAIIRFVNAIANEFAADYPDVMFDTLAYRYSRSVCKTVPADNVIVRLCTIECCFSHPLGTCPDVYGKAGSDNTIADDIRAWGAVTDNVYVWDYVTNYAEAVTIFPNFNTLLPNVKFFADHSVTGVYEEGNYFSETGDFSDLRCYIMAKILWDPFMSEEEYWGHIDDFLRGMYGRGWKNIRAYLDLAQELVRDTHFGIYDRAAECLYKNELSKRSRDELPDTLTLDMILNYETTDWSPYLLYYRSYAPSELVSRGYELFDAALVAADEDQAERIGKIKLQLDFLNSYTLYANANKDVLYDNIEQLLINFFDDHPDGGQIPVNEQKSYIRTIREHAAESYLASYEEYNRELYQRAVWYGITMIHEGDADISESKDQMNFDRVPREW